MLHMNELYRHLDRGDGTCRYYDEASRLCSIYSSRPEICNVDKMYDEFFKDIYSLDKYYELNYAGCQRLKAINEGEG